MKSFMKFYLEEAVYKPKIVDLKTYGPNQYFYRIEPEGDVFYDILMTKSHADEFGVFDVEFGPMGNRITRPTSALKVLRSVIDMIWTVLNERKELRISYIPSNEFGDKLGNLYSFMQSVFGKYIVKTWTDDEEITLELSLEPVLA